jgi:hypothetical protein
MTYALKLRHPTSGGLLPLFAHRYRLTAVPTKVGKYNWFAPKFEDRGLVTAAEYRAAKDAPGRLSGRRAARSGRGGSTTLR